MQATCSMKQTFAVFLLLGFGLITQQTGAINGQHTTSTTTTTTTTTQEDYFAFSLITWRDDLTPTSLSCELGNAVARARSLPIDGPSKNLSTMINTTQGICKTLTKLIGKNGTLASNITKPMKRNLRILMGSLKDIHKKYKEFLEDVDLIKRILKTSRRHIPATSGYGNVDSYLREVDELFNKSVKWWNVNKLTVKLYDLGKTLQTNLFAVYDQMSHQKAKTKMYKLHNKIANLKVIVTDIIRDLPILKKHANTFLDKYGKKFACDGCRDSTDSYCLSGICRPGSFGSACQLENYEFGRCTRLGSGIVTTYDGDVYNTNQTDTNGLTFYNGGNFLSFNVRDIDFADIEAAIRVTLMEEEYTLMANGKLKVNGVTGPLPLTKTYTTPESPISGKVTVQQIGQALVLQSNIHQLTVEFSTDGSNDVTVSLSVYWKTLVSGKCGSFNTSLN